MQCPSPESSYCDYPDTMACGATDGSGVCQPRPTTCTKECTMVCGCDGKVYCNACEAHMAGTDDVSTTYCTDSGTPVARP